MIVQCSHHSVAHEASLLIVAHLRQRAIWIVNADEFVLHLIDKYHKMPQIMWKNGILRYGRTTTRKMY